MTWRDTIPSGAPDECFESTTFGEALYFAQLELDLIAAEGQECSRHYTKRQLRNLRLWVQNNRATVKAFQEGRE